jgi:hypothetical protein
MQQCFSPTMQQQLLRLEGRRLALRAKRSRRPRRTPPEEKHTERGRWHGFESAFRRPSKARDEKTHGELPLAPKVPPFGKVTKHATVGCFAPVRVRCTHI